MPRRKQLKFLAKNTLIYGMIVDELMKDLELAADYDMDTIEITIKKKLRPFIKDVKQDNQQYSGLN